MKPWVTEVFIISQKVKVSYSFRLQNVSTQRGREEISRLSAFKKIVVYPDNQFTEYFNLYENGDIILGSSLNRVSAGNYLAGINFGEEYLIWLRRRLGEPALTAQLLWLMLRLSVFF